LIEKVDRLKNRLKQEAMDALKAGNQSVFQTKIAQLKTLESEGCADQGAEKNVCSPKNLEVLTPEKEIIFPASIDTDDLFVEAKNWQLTTEQRGVVLVMAREYLVKKRVVSTLNSIYQIDRRVLRAAVGVILQMVDEVTKKLSGGSDATLTVVDIKKTIQIGWQDRENTMTQTLRIFSDLVKELRQASYKSAFWGKWALSNEKIDRVFCRPDGAWLKDVVQLKENIVLKNNLATENELVRQVGQREKFAQQLIEKVRPKLNESVISGDNVKNLPVKEKERRDLIWLRSVIFNFIRTGVNYQPIVEHSTLTKTSSKNKAEDWLLKLFGQEMYQMPMTEWLAMIEYVEDLYRQMEELISKNESKINLSNSPEKVIDVSFRNQLYHSIFGNYLVISQPDCLEPDRQRYLIDQGWLIKAGRKLYPSRELVNQLYRMENEMVKERPGDGVNLVDLPGYFKGLEGGIFKVKQAEKTPTKLERDRRYEAARKAWAVFEEETVKNDLARQAINSQLKSIQHSLTHFERHGRLKIKPYRVAEYIKNKLSRDEVVRRRDNLVIERAEMRRNITETEDIRLKLSESVEINYMLNLAEKQLASHRVVFENLEQRIDELNCDMRVAKQDIDDIQNRVKELEEKIQHKYKVRRSLQKDMPKWLMAEVESYWQTCVPNSPYYSELKKNPLRKERAYGRERMQWDVWTVKMWEIWQLKSEVKLANYRMGANRKYLKDIINQLNGNLENRKDLAKRIDMLDNWRRKSDRVAKATDAIKRKAWKELKELLYGQDDMDQARCLISAVDGVADRVIYEENKQYMSDEYLRLVMNIDSWVPKKLLNNSRRLRRMFDDKKDLINFIAETKNPYLSQSKRQQWEVDKQLLLSGLIHPGAPEMDRPMMINEYYQFYRKTMQVIRDHFELERMDQRIAELDEDIYHKCQEIHRKKLLKKKDQLEGSRSRLPDRTKMKKKLFDKLSKLNFVYDWQG